MRLKHFLISLSCLLCLASQAQQTPKLRGLVTANSPRGNYIFLVNKYDLNDTVKMQAIDHFIIKRSLVTGSLTPSAIPEYQKTLKQIALIKRPTTLKELAAVLPNKELELLQLTMGVKDKQGVLDFIQSHPTPISFGQLYALVETRMALTHVFLDREVSNGQVYFYQVFSVDKQQRISDWGMAVAMAGAGNYKLGHYHAQTNGVSVKDSSVSMRWSLPLNIGADTITKPSKRYQYDPEGLLYISAFSPFTIRATVHWTINGNTQIAKGLLFPVLNKTKDTLFYNIARHANPNDVVDAHLVLEDEVHNIGANSDTLHGFIVTSGSAPMLGGLAVQDSLNGLYIHWQPLPINPYIAGVRLVRYENSTIGDTLSILPARDTAFMDHSAKVGINYRYEASVVYLPGMAAKQSIPSSSFGTITKFSRPLPPYELVTTNQGQHIRLNWKVVNSPTIANYNIYRGTSPNNLLLIPSGLVTQTTYLDTSTSLSGGSVYYYAVTCENLKQDTSIFSNMATAIPHRKLDILPPSRITFYYANGVLNISWNDARQYDNKVAKYLVVKKAVGIDTDFKVATPMPLAVSQMKDSAIAAGIHYQYKVASISFKGDTSQYSEVAQFTLPAKKVAVMNYFSLLSTPKGILLTLPTATIANRKLYHIYRADGETTPFKKIASIPADQFEYVDTKVERGREYHYAVSITEIDGREGAIGESKSILNP